MPTGNWVVEVHQDLGPDGTRGGSGKPDPKRLRVGSSGLPAIRNLCDLGFVEGAQAEPDAEALGQGRVLGFGEPIFERGVGQEMRFVDEEQGALGQAAEVDDEGGGGGALEARGAEPAERGEVGDDAEGADGGERGGEDVVAGGVEALGEEGEGRAFAAAAPGRESCDACSGVC